MTKLKGFFRKRLMPILTSVGIIMSMALFSGCINEEISDYTVEEHIAMVSEKVEARYFAGDGKYEYTDYEVYPLYNANDELKYFLVDFQPFGYVYIWIWEPDGVLAHKLQYFRQVEREDEVWQRYTVVEDPGDYISDEEIIWEVNENGEYIYYQDSHFRVAGIENEKRYLLESEGAYIPAVKKNGGYLNLISMEIMEEYNPILKFDMYPTANISFAPNWQLFAL